MTDTSSVVQITITKETRTLSQIGFGTTMILGSNGTFTVNTVRKYEDIDEVAEDFASTDAEYKAAEAEFAQSPRPESVKIGVRAAPVAQIQTLTFDADLIADNVVNLDIDNVAISPVTYATSHDDTMAALASEIQSHDSVSAASVIGGAGSRVIQITAAKAGIPFVVDNIEVTGGGSQANGAMATTQDNVGVTEDLNAIVLNDNEWYDLKLTSRDEDEVELASAWIETKKKIFGTCSDDEDIKDPESTTDIGYKLQASNRDRTYSCYNEDPNDWLDAAWAGRCLPKDPGSITWKFKTVSGPTVSSLSATERSAVLAKNVNLYTEIGGQDMMEEGTMASGEFIDSVRGDDWLEARMGENVFNTIKNADKIPYSNAGIAIIEAQIRKTLELAIRKGVVRPAPDLFDGDPYIVLVPLVSEVSSNDRGNRLLPDVTWQAARAGAVHKVIIQGRIVL